MFPVKEFEKRFRGLLEALDSLRDEAPDEAAEAMDEINAEFEDALFMIECIDQNDEAWQEEFADSMEELEDLCGSYRKLSEAFPALAAEADRMAMVIRMAQANLGQ